MKFLNGTEVFSADNDKIGNVERVVIDPLTDQVSHLVISKGFLFPTDKVLPVDWVSQAGEDRLTINRPAEAFDCLPEFEEECYVPTHLGEGPPAPMPYYAYPGPIGGVRGSYDRYSWPNFTAHTVQNIPEGSVALAEGTPVYSRDGKHIGNVEQVFVNPDTLTATHLLIGSGFLLPEHKLVPTLWIERAGAEKIHLAIRAEIFEEIPEYKAAD